MTTEQGVVAINNTHGLKPSDVAQLHQLKEKFPSMSSPNKKEDYCCTGCGDWAPFSPHMPKSWICCEGCGVHCSECTDSTIFSCNDHICDSCLGIFKKNATDKQLKLLDLLRKDHKHLNQRQTEDSGTLDTIELTRLFSTLVDTFAGMTVVHCICGNVFLAAEESDYVRQMASVEEIGQESKRISRKCESCYRGSVDLPPLTGCLDKFSKDHLDRIPFADFLIIQSKLDMAALFVKKKIEEVMFILNGRH